MVNRNLDFSKFHLKLDEQEREKAEVRERKKAKNEKKKNKRGFIYGENDVVLESRTT